MKETIGVVGLGNMGFGMAENLVKAGFPVRGFDKRTAPLERLAVAGGTPVASAGAAGEGASAVVVMVMNAAQAKEVITGVNGVATTMEAGSTVILSATIGVRPASEIGSELEKQGIEMLDCCVSGGQRGATSGTLALMVGGPRETFQRRLEVLETVGDPEKITHVGEHVGDGQAAKACLQALISSSYPAICEALVLGAKLGLDADIVQKVLESGLPGSPLVSLIAGHVNKREFVGTGSQIATLYKDIDLTLQTAREAGVALPTAALAGQFLQATMTTYPDEDCWAIAKVFETLGDTIVKSTALEIHS
jgi:L-threonate 2-dehydrogenase